MTNLPANLAADAFRAVGRSDAVPNNFVVPYYLDDHKLRISIARVGHGLYAFDDLCICADKACRLSGGLLTGRTIMCQCHGSRFDICTGAVVNGPATEALNVYEVQEVQGQLSNPTFRPSARPVAANQNGICHVISFPYVQ
jgi:3-phenylpropionate/trans-cinnamate dioxygenase ferredoxin component